MLLYDEKHRSDRKRVEEQQRVLKVGSERNGTEASTTSGASETDCCVSVPRRTGASRLADPSCGSGTVSCYRKGGPQGCPQQPGAVNSPVPSTAEPMRADCWINILVGVLQMFRHQPCQASLAQSQHRRSCVEGADSCPVPRQARRRVAGADQHHLAGARSHRQSRCRGSPAGLVPTNTAIRGAGGDR